uniref:Uncharacterized protein n=1 Tax=Strigamia maritima TaxID=126957 RepID=T1IY99_STRMM
MQIANWHKNNMTAHSYKHVWRADQNQVTYGKLQPSYNNQNKKYEGKQQKIASKTWQDLIDDFWSRTTIQGVSQIGTRKLFIWKILWVFVALSGAAMALYQSRDVLQDYYGKSTIQKMTFKSKDAPFPAITICKTVKVKSAVSELSSNSEEAADHDLWLNETYDPQHSLTYIVKCKFGTTACNVTNEDDIFPWSNPKYGSCFTFNSGFNAVKTLDTSAGLHLIIGMTDYAENSEFSDFTVIIIHQSKTPPSLNAAQYTVINPKTLITIKLKARELIKLEGSVDCVLPDSNKAKKDNFYHSKATPYIITTPK